MSEWISVKDELIDEILEYIKNVEQKIEGEFGMCRTFEQMIADGDAPEIYNKLKALKKAAWQ